MEVEEEAEMLRKRCDSVRVIAKIEGRWDSKAEVAIELMTALYRLEGR